MRRPDRRRRGDGQRRRERAPRRRRALEPLHPVQLRREPERDHHGDRRRPYAGARGRPRDRDRLPGPEPDRRFLGLRELPSLTAVRARILSAGRFRLCGRDRTPERRHPSGPAVRHRGASAGDPDCLPFTAQPSEGRCLRRHRPTRANDERGRAASARAAFTSVEVLERRDPFAPTARSTRCIIHVFEWDDALIQSYPCTAPRLTTEEVSRLTAALDALIPTDAP